MSKKINFLIIVFASLIVILSISLNPLSAASIRLQVNEEMGCNILVEGAIEVGDADTLRNLIEQQAPSMSSIGYWEVKASPIGRRICFNSPGGSMVEAMKMAEIISGGLTSRGPGGSQLGTAVGRNARCESACALAFMAGSFGHPEGEIVRPNRIIHPTARLGFHRPELIVSAGNYSEETVNVAFSIALDTLGLIIDARSARWFDFPESLFTVMLNTPHDSMYFVQTVGEASRLSISVAPSPFFAGDTAQAILNFCTSVDGALLDVEPAGTFGGYMEAVDPYYNDDKGAWVIDRGFREEAGTGCSVVINTYGEHSTDFVGYAVIGDYSPDRQMQFLPFQSFPSETPISALMSAPTFSAVDFIDRARILARRDSIEACWLPLTTARIANVNEYANLRRQPDFSAPIIRRAPLGEIVRLVQANSMWFIEAQPGRELCYEACLAVGANPQDTTAAGRVRQCIDDNRLWYEISDTRGNRGWVSRKFLVKVE